MKLLELYKKMSEDKDAFEKYRKTGKENYGKMFGFLSTNYRYLKTFEKDYHIFKEIDGIDRELWEKYEKNGQDKYKQYVVNMINTKFFYKNERVYYTTEKGKVIESLSDSKYNFSKEEKWLIIFLLISNSTFENTSCYPFEEAKKVFEKIIASGLEEEKFIFLIKKFLLETKNHRNLAKIFDYDYTYLDSFYKIYKEYDFLNIYLSSTKEEKEKLYDYIKQNKENKKYNCILSMKYKPGGVYDKEMLRTNAKILYLVNKVLNSEVVDFNAFVDVLIDSYKEIESIDEGKIRQFIYGNKSFKSVFEVIYFEIFEIDYLDFDSNKEDLIKTKEELEEVEKLDDTTALSVEKIRRISTILKKQAKERTNYKCELEEINMCKYFTSKDTNRNYLEVHHFIPREFSNNYERTIEVIENYISLCPSCHRLIHNGTDRERIKVINYLFNKRKDLLERKGLLIDIKTIEQYYKIDEE